MEAARSQIQGSGEGGIRSDFVEVPEAPEFPAPRQAGFDFPAIVLEPDHSPLEEGEFYEAQLAAQLARQDGYEPFTRGALGVTIHSRYQARARKRIGRLLEKGVIEYRGQRRRTWWGGLPVKAYRFVDRASERRLGEYNSD